MRVIYTVYITFPNEATANSICEEIIKKRLAACANIFPIKSIYYWDEVMQNETEWAGHLKTIDLQLEKLSALVRKIHPYALPCISYWPINANAEYEAWVIQNSQGL